MRPILIWTIRIAVLAVVCIGVYGTVRSAVGELSRYEWKLRPGWLALSGLIYIVGLLPMAWFWRRILAAFGYPVPPIAALRAYYVSQVGKYVPGKATVVILRVAAVRRWVPSMRLAIVSVFLETLTLMSAGATLALMMMLFVLHTDALFSLLALGMAIATGVPTLPPVGRRIAAVGAQPKQDEEQDTLRAKEDLKRRLRRITFAVLGEGWCAASISWIVMAFSLWATLRSIGADEIGIAKDWGALIAAVAFSVVAGFVSMLPAGLVAREGSLVYLLAPACGAANALVAAVLFRLVGLVSELVACGILYIGRGSGAKPQVGGDRLG
jgi:glycosyltransferase 2 family protein